MALSYLIKASEFAPRWRYPVYDRVYTYMVMKDFDSDRIYYKKTLDLAPRGFFTAFTTIDAHNREKNGLLPKGE
jgi:hypothetical protein